MQAELQELLSAGAEEKAAHEQLFSELQRVSAENKKQLATALRGVELLQASNGPDPKLLSMTKLHMLGEVIAICHVVCAPLDCSDHR